ncbi:hypothetical protein SO802_035287, partial [Lithocarpus litseifolius]
MIDILETISGPNLCEEKAYARKQRKTRTQKVINLSICGLVGISVHTANTAVNKRAHFTQVKIEGQCMGHNMHTRFNLVKVFMSFQYVNGKRRSLKIAEPGWLGCNRQNMNENVEKRPPKINLKQMDWMIKAAEFSL